jgi:methylated-DNA-[protein]-cysteine S-methyltransferase
VEIERHSRLKFQSPLGELLLKVNDCGVEWLKLVGHNFRENHRPAKLEVVGGQRQGLQRSLVKDVHRQLAAYFSGKVIRFDLPLSLKGTEFQKSVWTELQKIPYGQTQTYSQVARAIGSPRSVRAVAGACAQNPVWIISPCHRVVPSSGGVGGYAGGTAVKQWLLQHEGVDLRAPIVLC